MKERERERERERDHKGRMYRSLEKVPWDFSNGSEDSPPLRTASGNLFYTYYFQVFVPLSNREKEKR